MLPEANTLQIGARNREFPTWSWAGQGANIRFLDKYGRSPTALALSTLVFDANIWVERPDGTTVRWDEFVTKGGCQLPRSELTPYLHIECWVFKVGPFRQFKLKGMVSGAPVFCIPASGNYDEDPPERVREFQPGFFHSTSSSLFTSEFEAICFEPPEKARFALVLDTVNGVLERIGLQDFVVYEVDDGTQLALEHTLGKVDVYPQAHRRRIRLG